MFQQYLRQSTQRVVETLELAVSELASARQNVLNSDFILLGLLSQKDSEAIQILSQLLPEPGPAIRKMVDSLYSHYEHSGTLEGNKIQVVVTQEVNDVFRIALVNRSGVDDDDD